VHEIARLSAVLSSDDLDRDPANCLSLRERFQGNGEILSRSERLWSGIQVAL
jgi:hypothetical protein